MHTLLSVISAILFVSFGGLNVWIMLTSRPSSKPFGRMWTHIHHVIGYVLIGVFAITVYFMLLRLRGETDELPPRILVHMSLALILAPLLVAKVLTARHRGPYGLLLALGISIFAISFALIAINIVPLLLRNLSDGPIPTAPTAAVILVVGGALGTLLVRRPRVATPGPGAASRPSTASERPEGEDADADLVVCRDADT